MFVMTIYRAELRLRKVFGYARRLWVRTWRSGYLHLVAQIRIGNFYLVLVKLEPPPEMPRYITDKPEQGDY